MTRTSFFLISLIAISVAIPPQLSLSLASEIAELSYAFNVTLGEFDEAVSPSFQISTQSPSIKILTVRVECYVEAGESGDSNLDIYVSYPDTVTVGSSGSFAYSLTMQYGFPSGYRGYVSAFVDYAKSQTSVQPEGRIGVYMGGHYPTGTAAEDGFPTRMRLKAWGASASVFVGECKWTISFEGTVSQGNASELYLVVAIVVGTTVSAVAVYTVRGSRPRSTPRPKETVDEDTKPW